MTAVAVLGALAAGSSFLFVWPQVVKTARTGDVDGVSVPATLVAMAGFLMWILYGGREGLPVVVVANVQAALGFGLVVAMVARRRPVPVRAWAGAAAGAALIAAAFVAAPPWAFGATAVLVSSVGFLPQAVVAVRQSDLSGLSISTYLLIALSTSTWAAYGLAEGDPFVVAPTAVILPSVLTIAVRIRLTAGAPAVALADGPA